MPLLYRPRKTAITAPRRAPAPSSAIAPKSAACPLAVEIRFCVPVRGAMAPFSHAGLSYSAALLTATVSEPRTRTVIKSDSY